MKDCTCAVAITDGKKVLVCHPTGASHIGSFSLPKGKVDKNESYLDAAIREVKEETGYIIEFPEKIKYIGKFKYVKDKNYALFIYKIKNLPNIESLKCESTFKNTFDISVKEVDYYKYITIDELSEINKNQFKILKEYKHEIFDI